MQQQLFGLDLFLSRGLHTIADSMIFFIFFFFLSFSRPFHPEEISTLSPQHPGGKKWPGWARQCAVLSRARPRSVLLAAVCPRAKPPCAVPKTQREARIAIASSSISAASSSFCRARARVPYCCPTQRTGAALVLVAVCVCLP